MSKPRLGELVAALSGLGLLAVSLLPWYDVGGAGGSLNAWEAFDVADVVMSIPVVLMVCVAIIDWFGISDSLPVPASSTAAGFALVAIVLVGYRAIDPAGGEGVEREPALFAGLACLVGVCLGAFVSMWEASPRPSATAAGPSES